jgi:hypothetical protein
MRIFILLLAFSTWTTIVFGQGKTNEWSGACPGTDGNMHMIFSGNILFHEIPGRKLLFYCEKKGKSIKAWTLLPEPGAGYSYNPEFIKFRYLEGIGKCYTQFLPFLTYQIIHETPDSVVLVDKYEEKLFLKKSLFEKELPETESWLSVNEKWFKGQAGPAYSKLLKPEK